MKYKYLMMTTLMVVFGYSEMSVAHEQAGALGSKRSNASASNTYKVTCPDIATAQIAFSVKELTPTRPKYRRQNQVYWNPALVSIKAVDTVSNKVSAVSTVPRGGLKGCRPIGDSDNCFSPEITLVAGQGPYNLIVIKPESRIRGTVTFNADAHCLDINGNHTDNETIELILKQ